VGLYDEKFYPAYHEDNDYSYRCRLAGIERDDITDHDGIIHHGSSTINRLNSKEKAVFENNWEASRVYYKNKWGGFPDQEIFTSPFDSDHKSPKKLEGRYREACNTRSDINEHLSLIYDMAKQCEHVTEFGIGHGNSTIAILNAKPKTYIGYEITPLSEVKTLQLLATETNFILKGDCLQEPIEETDMLMIDTVGTYNQLNAELNMHANQVKKYIIIHDTVAWGDKGEDGGIGIMPAIREFLGNKEWKMIADRKNNNGLIVLQRQL
jgi:hypothetical protein